MYARMLRAVLILGPILGLMAVASLRAHSEEFKFIALGDMPYRLPGDVAKFDRLIGKINSLKPAFSIHVGDTKSGSSRCSDEAYEVILNQLQTFEQPLVYTPGDNEWTDCHRAKAGGYNPRERLAKVRAIFFAKAGQSLGKSPMPLETQAVIGDRYGQFVENTRFTKSDVLFVQVHVVGSNNGFEPRDLDTVKEYFARNEANIAWLDASFQKAINDKAKAVVVSMQANMYEIHQKWPAMPSASGFLDTVRSITRGAKKFGRPVLVVNGDAHTLEILPFKGTNLKDVPNVTRLQVMGARQVHAVEVTVTPDSPGVFGFRPLIIPENYD